MAYDVELKPVIKDESGLTELSEKIKKFEDEGINLKVNINKTDGKTEAEINKNIKLLKNFIAELNQVQTYPNTIDKTVKLHVEIDNLTKEITEGLAVLNKVSPNIAVNTDDIEKRFIELRKEYSNLYNKYGDITDNLYQPEGYEKLEDFRDEFNQSINLAKELYGIVGKIDYLLSKDSTLESRFGNMDSLETAESLLGAVTGDVQTFAETLKLSEDEIDKIINQISKRTNPISDAEVFNTAKIKETQGELAKVEKETQNVRTSNESLSASAESFADRFFKAITGLHDKLNDLNNDSLKSLSDSMARIKTLVGQMNKAVQEIKSPFDETAISNTAGRLEELFKQYNALDGTEKIMRIAVEISPEDEKKLQDVAGFADQIKESLAKMTTYRAIGSNGGSKKNTKVDSEIPVSPKNKSSKTTNTNELSVIQQTNKAVEAYDKLIPKEVKITLLIENLQALQNAVDYIGIIDKRNKKVSSQQSETKKISTQSGVFTPSDSAKVPKYVTDLLSAYDKIKDKQVKIEFYFPNYDQFNTVVAGAEEINSLNRSGGAKVAGKSTSSSTISSNSVKSSNAKANPEIAGSLKMLLIGLDNIFKQVKDINGKIASAKTETPQKATKAQPQESSAKPVTPNTTDNQEKTINVEGIIKKLESIQKKIPTVESLTGKKSGKTNNENKGDSANISSLISTLIDPKLSVIQQSVTNIDTNLTNGTIGNKDSEKDKTPPVASDDVKNINKNVTDILTAINKLGENKKASSSKKSDTPKSSSKDIVSAIKGKLDTLPTKLNAIQQSNSSISKNTKATQTNTGNTSNNVRYVRDTIKSSTNTIVSHLTNIENNTKQAENPNAPTNSNFATLETAIQNLTTALQNPSALQNAQNTQNSNTAPNAAQVAATLSNVSNLKAQSDNRIKELQKVLGIMGNGNFSSIFGSTQDVQSYINSLETLNKEIANAGRMLNRNDISPAQRTSAENTLQTKATVLNGIINGDNSLGFDTAKINNIITLLRNMETINSRIGGADGALQGLTKLKDTLSGYKITVQPLEDAINSLKSTKQELNNLTERLADSSLDEAQFQQITSAIATNQQKYQDAIDNATKILNTEQPDSIQSITTNFITAQKEIEKYQAKVDNLKDLLQNLKNKNIDPTKLNMGNGKTAKDLQNFLNTYEQFLNQNRNLSNPQEMQAFATNFQTNYQQPLDQYVSGLRQANRELSNMTSITRQAANADSFAKKVADFTTRVQKWGNTNSTALKDKNYLREYERILGELTSGAAITEERLRQLKTQFAQLNLRVNQAGVATKSFTDKLKEMFKKYGGWTLVTRTLNTAMRLLRSMVTQVKEVDTAMTNLRKVTEATGRQLNDFLESAGKRSVSLGASLTDYIDAVSEFSRLGKKIDEAQRLGELATMYKTVAEDLDIKTASQSLISTMQAFSQAGVQAEEIVDKFNYVGNNFAASSADIGVALQKSASALYGAQNTLSESVALITAGNEIVQNAEIIGTQLKTISARIRGTKDELGEDADDLVITTSKLRKEIKALTDVDIMENENTFKSTYQILKEISEVYNTLTDQKQSRVSELLGGKLGLNVVQSILGNFETAKQIVEELDEGLADNSASKELEKSLDSIQAKLNQLKSTWQQFSTDFLDTGFVKGFVDALKGLVSVLDSLTKITGKFSLASRAALGAGLFANVLSKRQTGGLLFGGANGGVIGKTFLPGIQPQSLMSVYDYFNQSQKLKLAARQGKDLGSVTGVNAQLREFIQNTDQANVSISNFYASQTKSAKGFLGSIQAIRTYNNISEQNVAQRKAFAKAVSVSNEKLGQELQNLQGSNAGIRTYTKSLGGLVLKQATATAATLAFNVAISVGVALIVQGISKLVNSYEEAQEKNAELIKSFKETSDSLQEERDNLEDLLSQYSNILVTTTDLASAQNQLIDIQEKITDVFGEEVDGLNLLNKSYGENIALIQKKRREDAKQFVDDKKNRDEYEAAQKYLEQEGTISENFGHFSAKNNATLIKAKGIGDFSGARNAIRGENTVLSQWAGTIGVTGTAGQQVAALQRIYDNLSDLWADTDLDSNQRKWLRDIKDRIDELNNAIEESKRIISEWEIKQAIADSTDLSPETIRNIDKIKEAIALLQQANTSSDIITASEQYQALKDSIYAAIPEEDEETRGLVDSYFQEIEKNIDQSILNIRDKGKVYEQTLKKFQDETYSAFSDGITKIDNALKTVSLGGSIDSSTLLELAKIDSSLLGEFTKTADGYTLSIEALNKARKKLIEGQKADVEDEIESNKKFIEDQKSLIEFYTKYDTNGFLINSKEREQAEEDKKDAEKGYKDNITALYSDEGIGDQFFIDHPELLQYKDDVEALADEIEKIAHTNTSPVIEQLQQAIEEAKNVGDLESVIRYTSMLEQLTSESEFGNLRTLEAQKKELREQIKQKELYIKGLERQKDKEEKILDSLNKQKEALESIASDYETAAKTAQDYIDDQIEALDKEIDKLEEHKQAIEDDFDARIQAIKDEIDAIEKESDALEKEAEMQERLNDLKEKELALEKARQQKVRVYTSERGWEIQSNAEEIAKAQKDYDEALKNHNKQKAKEEEDARIAALQAQIEQLEAEKEAALAAVDEQIKGIEAMKQEYEEYKQLWEDTLNAYQKMQDEMTAAAILGSDWREKIAEKDTEIVNTFAEKYNEVQEQIHGVIEKQIEEHQKLIDKYDEQINVQNDLKSAQEQYLGYYETYSQKFVDLTDAQTAALERLKNAIGAGDSEGALDAALNAENVLENDSQKKKTGVSSLDKLGVINKLMQTAPTSFMDGIVATVNAIKNLPNELKSIMNTNNSNKVNNDNRTQNININNPGFAMTYADFEPMFMETLRRLDQQAQTGKR